LFCTQLPLSKPGRVSALGFARNLEIMAVILVQDVIDLASDALAKEQPGVEDKGITKSRVYQHLATHPDFPPLMKSYCDNKQVRRHMRKLQPLLVNYS
jgi:hypothetical protein